VASRFDPFGIVTATEQTIRNGVGIARWSERQVDEHLRSRMDAVIPATIVRMVLDRMPETMEEAKDYAANTLAIENSSRVVH
jgi:hypothetical protein